MRIYFKYRPNDVAAQCRLHTYSANRGWFIDLNVIAAACQKYRTQGCFNLNETRTTGKTSIPLDYSERSIAEKQNYHTTFSYNNRN